MLTFFSPAKINFFFHVIGKRSDGYHEIVSLLHTVSFGDYIHFSPSKADHFTIKGNTEVPLDDRNLIIQAIKLFRSKTGWIQPFDIYLEKNIPMGSGLGGGSSNAATTLWALNDISKLGIPKDELQKWSATLGSDVPFFFSGGCAVCRGRGELVENKPPIREREIYLILNDQLINTKIVFSRVSRSEKRIDINTLIANTLRKKYPCINELEQAAFEVYPSLSNRKTDLCARFTGFVFMTGSGGTFVVIGEDIQEVFSDYSIVQVECMNRSKNRWYQQKNL